jgi:hypothetical protein
VKTVEQRFWEKVDKTSTCWLWTAYCDEKGYGRFRLNGTMIRVHRWTYERFVGPIPDGLVIDHLCRVRNCVKPGHLEVVTDAENWRRGQSPTVIHAFKTACNKGHDFTPENTYVRVIRGQRARICLTCRRAWSRNKARRVRAEARAAS